MIKRSLVTYLLLGASTPVGGFFLVPHFLSTLSSPWHHPLQASVQEEQETVKPCFYRAPVTNTWQPRINVLDLQVGQHLNGTVVQELLNARTGPKLFLDCGVGRIDARGEWQICNAMLRLGRTRMSVIKKRATRLRRKALVEVVVSRIYPDSARFEVILESTQLQPRQADLISASTLKPKQELVGEVVRVEPYGVMVDVGANRNGLLHIQRVADLYGKYIDKEKGLEQAGLERGARIRVQVLENVHKRLFLDFTDAVKQDAERQRQEEEESKKRETVVVATQAPEQVSDSSATYDISEEEAAAWAAYAEVDESTDDGDYDEDRDIEDALGLGSY